MNKTKNKWGVSGYDFPKFDPNFDKSFQAKISNSKKRSYLDEEMKRTSSIPAPGQYNTMGNGMLDPKKKGGISKTKKITFLAQIERDSARNHIPGPGHYKAKLSERPLGAMRLKEDKVSFIDEAQYRGKSTPSHYSVSYGSVL